MSAPAAAQPPAPLDDVMLAMDVVDTLRRRERLVAAEFDDARRRAELKERLHRIYAAQGIEVPDRILEEGVEALVRDRFTFDPPKRTLGVALAEIYVARGRWGRWAAGVAAVLVVAVAAWWFAVAAPEARLGGDLLAAREAVAAATTSEEALSEARESYAAGAAAVARDDPAAARDALAALERLRARLESACDLRIVNRPGELTGVWRVPEANPQAQNYDIIVEALDAAGNRVEVPVRNEETGEVERAATFGLRVDRETFERIAADKRDDGIIQGDAFGRKRRGELEPDYACPTTGAAITDW